MTLRRRPRRHGPERHAGGVGSNTGQRCSLLDGLDARDYSPSPFCPLVFMPTARVIPPLASTIFGWSEM